MEKTTYIWHLLTFHCEKRNVERSLIEVLSFLHSHPIRRSTGREKIPITTMMMIPIFISMCTFLY